jgi:hypothetical protein
VTQTQATVENDNKYFVLGYILITETPVMAAISTSCKNKIPINVILLATKLTNSFYIDNSPFTHCHYGSSPHT